MPTVSSIMNLAAFAGLEATPVQLKIDLSDELSRRHFGAARGGGRYRHFARASKRRDAADFVSAEPSCDRTRIIEKGSAGSCFPRRQRAKKGRSLRLACAQQHRLGCDGLGDYGGRADCCAALCATGGNGA